MYPYEPRNHDDELPVRRRGLDLWFYEQHGARYYFRLTRLALVIIFSLVIFSIVAILTMFFYQSNTPIEEPHVNIKLPPAPAYSPNKTLIKPAPPLPPPPRVRGNPNINANNPLGTPTPSRNVNGQ